MTSTFLFLMLVLLGPLMSTGFEVNPEVNTSGEGSVLRQACYVLVALMLLIALKPWENFSRFLAIPRPLFIGLAYCWISLFWAIEPAVSLRRLILTTMVMWVLFASMRQLKFEEAVKLLRIGLWQNRSPDRQLRHVILWPEFGMHGGNQLDEFSLAGDWRGALQHKNFAGAACAFTVILFAFDRGTMHRAIQIGVLAAASYFLYRSNSKTSVGLVVAALAAGFLFLRYKLRYKAVVLAIVSVLAIAATVAAAIFQNPLTAKLSDPKAFTGRTKIWKALWDYLVDHPLLGSGYGSFWNIGASSPIYTYGSGDVLVVPEAAYNGFLDVAVALGIPGFILILVVAIIMPFRKLLGSPLMVGSKGALLVGLFLFCHRSQFHGNIPSRSVTCWFG
ncbi:MAG: O-antigen ligase family protein [Sphingobium sp.]|nr:O-antigen ligase family protein [Sphingobium sp.]